MEKYYFLKSNNKNYKLLILRKNLIVLQTPILFLIFNRPDTTKAVFESIKSIKPLKLYIAADGARGNKLGEDLLVEETRAIIQSIDWDCEVKTLFRKENLGCKVAVSSAIDWFFENEEQGIILEDDCLPNTSFYGFCEELLNYYKTNERVFHISGNNFQDGMTRGDGSYYFSKYNHIWGWATWRRVWKTYDVNMKDLTKALDLKVFENTLSKSELSFWLNCFEEIKAGKKNTWDYQTMLNQWLHNGLTIIPNHNLVTNIGFGGGTNTSVEVKGLSNIETKTMDKIVHPSFIYSNKTADDYTYKTKYNPQLTYTIKQKLFGR
jgi:hypothetical protein